MSGYDDGYDEESIDALVGPQHGWDEEYDEDYVPPAPKSRVQVARERAQRVLPLVPLIPFVYGVAVESQYWLLIAVFLLLAVKPFKRYVSVTNCQFTGGDPALVIK